MAIPGLRSQRTDRVAHNRRTANRRHVSLLKCLPRESPYQLLIKKALHEDQNPDCCTRRLHPGLVVAGTEIAAQAPPQAEQLKKLAAEATKQTRRF